MSADPTESEPEGMEEESSAPAETSMGPTEVSSMAEAPVVGSESPMNAPPTKRTQLKVMRESVEALKIEFWRYRKAQEASSKRLEKQLASLQKDLASHAKAFDQGLHHKGHEEHAKKLEKHIVSLHSELGALRSQLAKDAAKGRAQQEAALSKMAAKLKANQAKKPKSKKR